MSSLTVRSTYPGTVRSASVTPISSRIGPRNASRIAYQPLRLAWPRRLALGLVATDALAVLIAVAVAQLGRFGVSESWTAALSSEYALVGVGVLVAWMVALAATRSRERRVIGAGSAEYQRVLNASIVTFALVAGVGFIAKIDLARGYLAIALPVGVALLLLGRYIWHQAVVRLRRAGRCLTGAFVVGSTLDVRRAVRELSSNVNAGFRPIAVSITDDPEPPDALMHLPVVPIEDVPGLSRQTRTRAVLVAGNLPGGHEQIRRLGWDLEDSHVELVLVSRLTDVAGPRMHLRPLGGIPLVHVDLPRYSGFAHVVKRLTDVAGSAIGLLLLSPLLAVIALAIRLSSPGPVFFRQNRVGVRGEQFPMLKFRSMVVDAEAQLSSLAATSDGNGMLFKMKADPRVTPIGRVLRRYSLDEIPQLWNVLVGDMSLVGPRPPLPAEVERYEDTVTRRLLIKPGITGLWQVSGRSHLSWEESVRLDLYYVENWSMTGDLVIMLKTLRAVLRPDGAY